MPRPHDQTRSEGPGPERATSPPSCPDGGTCHHACDPEGPCWRVLHAAPLSDYGSEDWDPHLRAEALLARADVLIGRLDEIQDRLRVIHPQLIRGRDVSTP